MFRLNFDLERIPNVDVNGMIQELSTGFPVQILKQKQRENILSLFFERELTEPEQSQLDAFLLRHDVKSWKTRISGLTITPTESEFLPPFDLDFSVGLKVALQKVNTVVHQGDILQTIYYARVGADGLPCDPVVQWDTVVEYSATHIDAFETISWYLNNGQLHPDTKNLHQRYSDQRWLDWLEGKRSQIIAWLRWNVAKAMIYNLVMHGDGSWTVGRVMDEGAGFFKEFGPGIATYISGNDRSVLVAIQADERTWLDGMWPGTSITIRHKFHEQMEY